MFSPETKKELLDATDIWGLDTVDTEDKMRERYGNVKI